MIYIVNFCWIEFKNNSDLLTAIVIYIIDIIYFIGKWFPNLPELVSSISYTSLCFIGLLNYPFLFMATKKKIVDIYMCIKYKNYIITIWNVFLIIILIESIISIGLYFVAALCLIFKFSSVANTIFKIYIPIGFINIFTNISNSIITFVLNIYIAKKLNNTDYNDLEIIYNVYVQHQKLTYRDYDKKIICLALLTRSNMDVGTWNAFYKEIKKRAEYTISNMNNDVMSVTLSHSLHYDYEEKTQSSLHNNDVMSVTLSHSLHYNYEEKTQSSLHNNEYIFLKRNLLKNIKIQRCMALFGLILNLMGDISMGLCKIFPYSKLQAVINIVMATLFDIKLVIKKTLQCIQRCSMKKNNTDDDVDNDYDYYDDDDYISIDTDDLL